MCIWIFNFQELKAWSKVYIWVIMLKYCVTFDHIVSNIIYPENIKCKLIPSTSSRWLYRKWQFRNILFPEDAVNIADIFVHNLNFNRPIILKFCTEHGSDTAVLCAKFQNDWTTK